MSPVGTVLEHRVISWMCELAGFGPRRGGTLTSGGTEATFTGAARRARRGAARRVDERRRRGSAGAALRRARALRGHARRRASSGSACATCSPFASRDLQAWIPTRSRRASTSSRATAVASWRSSRPPGSTATGSFDDLEAIAASVRRARRLAARRRRARRLGAAVARAPRPAARHRARALGRLGSAQDDAPAVSGGHAARARRARSRRARSRSARRTCSRRARGERVVGSGPAQLHVLAPRRRPQALGRAPALRRRRARRAVRLLLRARARCMWEEIAERPDFEAMHEPECEHPLLPLRRRADSWTTTRSTR